MENRIEERMLHPYEHQLQRTHPVNNVTKKKLIELLRRGMFNKMYSSQ